MQDFIQSLEMMKSHAHEYALYVAARALGGAVLTQDGRGIHVLDKDGNEVPVLRQEAHHSKCLNASVLHLHRDFRLAVKAAKRGR